MYPLNQCCILRGVFVLLYRHREFTYGQRDVAVSWISRLLRCRHPQQNWRGKSLGCGDFDVHVRAPLTNTGNCVELVECLGNCVLGIPWQVPPVDATSVAYLEELATSTHIKLKLFYVYKSTWTPITVVTFYRMSYNCLIY